MKINSLASLIVVVVLLCIAKPSYSEITDSTAYGFTITVESIIDQNRDSVYKYLVLDVARWWNPAHTFSKNSGNLIIQPKANGCFCEKLENGGSVRHMTVVYFDPGLTLRMIGAIGPLQGMAVNGTMTFIVLPEDKKAKVTLTYEVGGYTPGGIGKWASPVDMVLTDQMERLKAYSESVK